MLGSIAAENRRHQRVRNERKRTAFEQLNTTDAQLIAALSGKEVDAGGTGGGTRLGAGSGRRGGRIRSARVASAVRSRHTGAAAGVSGPARVLSSKLLPACR
jgi:hypothetical protein